MPKRDRGQTVRPVGVDRTEKNKRMGQFGAATEPDTEPNWNPDELRLKIAKHAEALVRGMRRIDPDFAPSVDGEDASHGGATPLPPHKS